ncbi:hypothetical protein LZG04_03955 [Saccharothrix sp. S26]|uniref:hypothetical protein n=1 Tax=Saccharothrix sp. S26 TaxID=2907215 RepID=UPI001F1F46E3|nr:hypothetical protein [Saccharothrix sp. S26]MCE6993969.1 hypothetical protein [Saccharothrix sp. S26]
MNQHLRAAAAGLAGTAGYTLLSRALKARAADHHESVQPVTVAAALTTGAEVRPRGPLNFALHWGYGAWGGVARGLLERRGLSGWRAEAAHLAVVWLPWRLLLRAKRGHRTRPSALALDFAKHSVYVLVTGAVHRGIRQR